MGEYIINPGKLKRDSDSANFKICSSQQSLEEHYVSSKKSLEYKIAEKTNK